MFQPSDLPDGIILLMTDELAAPADFLLHRMLATHLKERKHPRALILSVSEGITRWKALASKSVRLVFSRYPRRGFSRPSELTCLLSYHEWPPVERESATPP